MRISVLAVAALVAGPAHADPPGPPAPAPKSPAAPAPKSPAAPAAKSATVQRAIAGLDELLRRSKDPLRRESAALVLGVRGSSAALLLLRQALSKDGNLWVRARAAEALGLIGDPAAIPWLHSALDAEKDQRVRRTIAGALLHLGQSAAVKELLWQLKSGNNNTKAEVMLMLVRATGQPLGEDAEAWWDYFNERGGTLALARRPTGSPALLPLRGVAAEANRPAGPFLHARRPFTWREVPAVVLELGARREPVDRTVLEGYERAHGKIPDACLLLVRTDWRQVKHRLAPRAPVPAKVGDTTAPRPMRRVATESPVPWLEPDAVAFLLRRAPKLVGVGMDTPSLDAAPASAHPSRDALLAANRLALESVGDLDRLVASGTRLILLPGVAGSTATVLALLP